MNTLQPGVTIGARYEVLRQLGEGGYGSVYEARQLSTGQSVAIKVLHDAVGVSPEETQRQAARFAREIQIIAALSHPNIVRLIDSGQLSDGRIYTVLEYVDGDDLEKVLEREGKLSLSETLRLMTQVLEALSSAHEFGVIHRDLKPQNIMLSRTRSRRHARVLDFGIAALTESARGRDYEDLTKDRQALGTPAFMAPELLRDAIVTRGTDVYAWGLVFVQCVTGQQVVQAEHPVNIMLAQLKLDPVPIPPEIEHHPTGPVIQRALAKDPAQRFQDADAVLDALEVALEGGRPDVAMSMPFIAPVPSAPEPPTPQAADTIAQPIHELKRDLQLEVKTEISDIVTFDDEPPPSVAPSEVKTPIDTAAVQRPTLVDTEAPWLVPPAKSTPPLRLWLAIGGGALTLILLVVLLLLL